MTTNNYPNIGYTTLGFDRNFFKKVAVSATTFGGDSADGYQPDVVITFNTVGLMFLNLGSGATSVIEYSFNGQTVHGELNPTNASAALSFDNRPVSKIWFRVQAGSSGTINISVQAWSTA